MSEPFIFTSPTIEESYQFHQDFYRRQHERRVEDQLIEEMAELTQAILKRRRFPGQAKRSPAVRQETHDVLLCLEFFARNEGLKHAATVQGVCDKAAKMMRVTKEEGPGTYTP